MSRLQKFSRVLWIILLCNSCFGMTLEAVHGNYTSACIYSLMIAMSFIVVASNTDFNKEASDEGR